MPKKIPPALLYIFQKVSVELPFPLFIFFILELISNIQLLTVVLLPVFLTDSAGLQNDLSLTLNHLLSYMVPNNIFNPFSSKNIGIVALSLSGVYLFGILILVLVLSYCAWIKKKMQNMTFPRLVTFIGHLHSKALFFPLHCFFARAINLSTNCSDGEFYCNGIWKAVPIIFITLNLIFAVVKELFCFSIHRTQDPCAIKNNLHSQIALLQKFIIVLLFYLKEGSADKACVLISIICTLIILYMVHTRLPFYNTIMLKMSIIYTTICAFFALVAIARVFDNKDDLILFTLVACPVIMKLSLLRLKKSLLEILTANPKTAYQAVHIPAIVEEYIKKVSLFSMDDHTNKATLYSLGIMTGKIEELQGFQKHKLKEEAKKTAHNVALTKMLELLKKRPNDELLLINIILLYISVLEDRFKALSILNMVQSKKLSINAEISLEGLVRRLNALQYNERAENDSIHIEYFTYKTRTLKFKNMIQNEIAEQLKLWKMVQEGNIQTMDMIKYSEAINDQSNYIVKFWNKYFQSNENRYVNASMMYGLYMEIIQAIPSAGFKLIKRAYTSLNNKWHGDKDLFNIIKGKTAIITASIMPESIGKVTENSTSVKEIFKLGKEGLLGSNIALAMPSVIASKHNNFIRRYQKGIKQKIITKISTYAKTFEDEYFKAELTLNLHPQIDKGLNIVACVKKVSDYQSILIVDEEGTIVEASKDLKISMNLGTKIGLAKIESLSSDFARIDQAFKPLNAERNNLEIVLEGKKNNFFRIFFRSQGVSLIHKPVVETREDQEYFEENSNIMASGTLNLKSNRTGVFENIYSEGGLLSPANHRLLLSTMRTDDVVKNLFKPELITGGAFSEDEDQKIVGRSKETRKILRPQVTREEAEMICESYKEGQQILLNQKTPKSLTNLNCISYQTQVEPMIIDGILYKVYNMKEVPAEKEVQKKFIVVNSKNIMNEQEEDNRNQDEDDTLGDRFPNEEERSIYLRRNNSSTVSLAMVNLRHMQTITMQESRKSIKNLFNEIENQTPRNFAVVEEAKTVSTIEQKSYENVNGKKIIIAKAQSVIDSQTSGRNGAKRFREVLRSKKPDSVVRLTIFMVYIAAIVIICSLSVSYFYSNKSLDDMKDSMNLINTVNLRRDKALLAWQSIMVLYARSVELRPIDFRVPQYFAIALNSTLNMMSVSSQLSKQVDDFQDEDVTKTFYDKTISFWEPLTQTLFDGGKIGSMTANNVLYSYNMYVARYTGSLLDLKGARRVLFTMNNTANDYLYNLEGTIASISKFFERAKNNNIKLFKVIIALELLFVFTPLILTLFLIINTLQRYSKLSQAITKIQNHSLTWRIRQLESIEYHFQQHIEDSIIEYKDVKWLHNSKDITVGVVDKMSGATKRQIKRYSLRGVFLLASKYFILSIALTLLIVTFLSLTLSNSISHLNQLDKLNKRVTLSFDVGSTNKMALPAWLFTLIFQNQTDYTINYNDPGSELLRVTAEIGNANSKLLEGLADDDGDITDATILDMLNGNACNYVTATYQSDCGLYTNGHSFGLLGLEVKLYQVGDLFKQYVNSPVKSFDVAKSIYAVFAGRMLNLHLVIYDINDYMSQYLVGVFNEMADSQMDDTLEFFIMDLLVTIASIAVIRLFVLTTMQRLSGAMKKIIMVIPYKIIEDNKNAQFLLGETIR